jgi:hypothetical protein
MGSQESLPRVFSSNDLMSPLISLLKGVGIHKGAKKAVEVQSLLSLSCLPSPSQDICEWMELMLEVPLLPPSLPPLPSLPPPFLTARDRALSRSS